MTLGLIKRTFFECLKNSDSASFFLPCAGDDGGFTAIDKIMPGSSGGSKVVRQCYRTFFLRYWWWGWI